MKYYTYAHYTKDTKELFYIRKALTGRKLPDEHKQKIKEGSTVRKPVICLTTGIEYPSAFEAAQTLQISSSSSITKCCKGKRQTAGGFEWKYKD